MERSERWHSWLAVWRSGCLAGCCSCWLEVYKYLACATHRQALLVRYYVCISDRAIRPTSLYLNSRQPTTSLAPPPQEDAFSPLLPSSPPAPIARRRPVYMTKGFFLFFFTCHIRMIQKDQTFGSAPETIGISWHLSPESCPSCRQGRPPWPRFQSNRR